MSRRIKMCTMVVLLCGMLCMLVGCKKARDKEKVEKLPVEYVVCDETMIPGELTEIINEKAQDKFTLSYSTNVYTYIAVGYGLHDTDSYMAVLEDIFATNKAVYVKTSLISEDYMNEVGTATDGSAQMICGNPSLAPYIVLRCAKLELPIVYYTS